MGHSKAFWDERVEQHPDRTRERGLEWNSCHTSGRGKIFHGTRTALRLHRSVLPAGVLQVFPNIPAELQGAGFLLPRADPQPVLIKDLKAKLSAPLEGWAFPLIALSL